MTQKPRLYHVYSASPSGCTVEPQELARLEKFAICSSCHGPRGYHNPIHVRIEQKKGVHKPLDTAVNRFPGLILRSLLETFDRSAVEQDLYLGNVFGPDNELLEQWATYHGRRRLIVRGTQDVACRVCEVCQQTLYYASGKRHLFPTPPEDTQIFESDLAGLIFREDAFRKLDFRAWRRKVYIDELPIADESLDGLGELPQ